MEPGIYTDTRVNYWKVEHPHNRLNIRAIRGILNHLLIFYAPRPPRIRHCHKPEGRTATVTQPASCLQLQDKAAPLSSLQSGRRQPMILLT
jgi:hypothetical protein